MERGKFLKFIQCDFNFQLHIAQYILKGESGCRITQTAFESGCRITQTVFVCVHDCEDC